MDPKISLFLYVNGGIVVLLLAYMFFWRPKSEPSRLKLAEPLKKLASAPTAQQGASRRDQPSSREPQPHAAPAPTKERQLNIIFQFNGHDFDAYEVLGVPAGSALEAVEKSYRSLLSTTATDEHEFYRKAFESIRAKN